MRIRRKTQGTVRSWMRFSLSGTNQSWLQSSHYIPIHYAIFEATPIQNWDCRLRYIANPIVLFQPWPQATFNTPAKWMSQIMSTWKTTWEGKETPEGKRLSDCIRLSLEYLESEFSDWKETNSVNCEYSVSEMYSSLCVVTNQLWVPVFVLCRMLSSGQCEIFGEMSLAKPPYRTMGKNVSENPGIALHDLHLEYCEQ